MNKADLVTGMAVIDPDTNGSRGKHMMSKFCINCGCKGTLKAKEVPDNHETPFLEIGEFDGSCFSDERAVTILICTDCDHEMIDLTN
jgi:purine nucleoside permease